MNKPLPLPPGSKAVVGRMPIPVVGRKEVTDRWVPICAERHVPFTIFTVCSHLLHVFDQ